MNPKKKLPFGLRLVRVLTIIGMVLFIPTLILTLLAYSKAASSPGIEAAYFINIFTMVFSLAYAVILILSINRPRKALYTTLVSMVCVDILVSAVSFYLGQSLIVLVLSELFNVLFLWYVVKLKVYFKTGVIDNDEPQTRKTNRIFTVLLVILVVISLVGGIVSGVISGIEKAKTKATLANFFTELNGKSTQEALSYCLTLDDSRKDVCIYSTAFLSNSKINTKYKILKEGSDQLDPSKCETVKDAPIRISCYAALNSCDLLQDSKQIGICKGAVESFQKKLELQ